MGAGSVMKAMSRMSPPQAGHWSGNCSPMRARSLAHAIREVSWERGWSFPAGLVGREVDDALGVGCGRLARASGPDPGAAFVAGERVADPLRPAVSGLEQEESLEGEGGAGAIAQEVFEALEVVRDVAISERDAHARIDGKPAVLPGEHVGGGLGVDESPPSEPADEPAAHLRRRSPDG
jgi:hypothetical protein